MLRCFYFALCFIAVFVYGDDVGRSDQIASDRRKRSLSETVDWGFEDLLDTEDTIGTVYNSIGKRSPSKFTEEMKTIVVDEHNKHRRDEGTTDEIMLVWDELLADTAQAGANVCHYTHLSYRYQGKKFGQNVGISTGDLMGKHIKRILDSWYSERNDYDVKTHTCRENKICGHYTEMVLGRVSKIGCGIEKCPKVAMYDGPWHDAWVVYCNYDKPPTGLDPFKIGPACTACRVIPGSKCVDGLCAGCDPSKDTECKSYTCMDEELVYDRNVKGCSKRRPLCNDPKFKQRMAVMCPATCGLCPSWVEDQITVYEP